MINRNSPLFTNIYKDSEGNIIEEIRGPDGELLSISCSSNPPSNPFNSYSMFGWPGMGSWINPATQPTEPATCDDEADVTEDRKTDPMGLPAYKAEEETEVSTPCSCAFFSLQNGLPVSCEKCKKESNLDRRMNMYATLLKAANVIDQAGDTKLADTLRIYASTIVSWHVP